MKEINFLPSCSRSKLYGHAYTHFASALMGALIIALGVSLLAGFDISSSRRTGPSLSSCQFIPVIFATLGVVIGFLVMLTASALMCCCGYMKNVKIVRKSIPRQLFVC